MAVLIIFFFKYFITVILKNTFITFEVPKYKYQICDQKQPSVLNIRTFLCLKKRYEKNTSL